MQALTSFSSPSLNCHFSQTPSPFSLENKVGLQEDPLQEHPKEAILLAEGESLNVEPGGMLAFKNLKMATKNAVTGFSSIFKRYVLAGETLFLNTYVAQKDGGWITLEENQPGQIASSLLNPGGKGFVIRRGAYLASTSNVFFDTKVAGLNGYLQGKGIAITIAKVNEGDKPGRVYFHTPYGVAKKFHICANDKPVTIDNDMILGYTEGLEITIKKINGIKSLFFSGEGFVCEFKGQGDIYIGWKRQSDESNALHGMIKTSAEIASAWVVKGISATIFSLFIYHLCEEFKKNPSFLFSSLFDSTCAK